MESTVVEALNTIGAAVGIPAALLIGWLFISVRRNTQKIEELEKAREADKARRAEELTKVYDKLDLLVSDVSFIKGRLFKDE